MKKIIRETYRKEIISETDCIDNMIKRQTYYIAADTITALAVKAALEGRDKSEIVRAALDNYIEHKYFKIK